jgi:hypothetical protein
MPNDNPFRLLPPDQRWTPTQPRCSLRRGSGAAITSLPTNPLPTQKNRPFSKKSFTFDSYKIAKDDPSPKIP